jgi:hypothetical protein
VFLVKSDQQDDTGNEYADRNPKLNITQNGLQHETTSKLDCPNLPAVVRFLQASLALTAASESYAPLLFGSKKLAIGQAIFSRRDVQRGRSSQDGSKSFRAALRLGADNFAAV